MMFTPCGPRAVPTGGAGVAAPACSCTLTSAAIFFLGGLLFRILCVVRRGLVELEAGTPTLALPPGCCFAERSDLLDLREAQLDRGLPAEDLDEGLDPLGLGVDLGDRRVERGERTVDDHDRVGDVEVGDLDRLLGRTATARRRGAGGDRLGLGAGHDG